MKWIAFILVLALTVAARGQPPQEPAFQAAGDGHNLWIVQPLAPGELAFSVFYRRQGDPLGSLMRAGVSGFTGRPALGGVAAVDDQLWIVYDNNFWVQTMVMAVDEDTGLVEPSEPSLEPALPRAAALMAFTADDSGPWALLRIESRSVLDQIDNPPPSNDDEDDDDDDSPAASEPAATAPAATAPAAPQAVNAARLLRLDHTRWVKVDLPDDWPRDARAWLLSPHPGSDYPVLLAAPRGGGELWAYRHDSHGWTRHVHKYDTAGHLAATVVEGQVIVARQHDDGGNLTVEPTLLRSGSDSRLPTMTLSGMAGSSWAVARAGQSLALIARDKNDLRKWTCESLSGRVVVPPTDLVERFGHSLMEGKGFSPQVIFMVVSLLIMFLVWRRDGQGARVELPTGFVVAPLSRRAVAGLIDLAPCVLIVSVFWGVPLRDLAAGWINPNPEWDSLRPMLAIVGLFVIYSCLAEVFTARTIGKAVLRLHVVSVHATPPNIWQVIARNLLKTLDVMFPPVLLVPLMQPYAQRLGDMAAHTIVVMPEPKTDHHDDAGGPPKDGKS